MWVSVAELLVSEGADVMVSDWDAARCAWRSMNLGVTR